MGTLLKIFLALAVSGMIGTACEGPKRDELDNSDPRNDGSAASTGSSTREDGYLLDATSANSCENYLKGKTFTGGTARLKFGFDGSVSAYDPSGVLVFGGTLEIGSAKSDVSRWVYIRSVSGGGKLQFLLSNDGKMMEQSSLVIYKPE